MGALDIMGAGADLDADAFRRLYPEKYLLRFLDNGIRPDSRVTGKGRPVTIGVGTISSADGSALVKLGRSSALAGVKLELARPEEGCSGAGSLSFNVEIAPFAMGGADHLKAGRQPEWLRTLSLQLHASLLGSGLVDLQQLSLNEGKSCWRATVDVYILDVDGAVFDVVLLAVVAALRSTVLPAVTISQDGQSVRRSAAAAGSGNSDSSAQAAAAAGSSTKAASLLQLSATPISCTFGICGSHTLTDPTYEEEKVCSSSVTIVTTGERMFGVYHLGGPGVSPGVTRCCMEASRLRYKQLLSALDQALITADSREAS
ncbi:MAG: hypothetical protein WDW38_004196 [Sanguina aurantia]